MGELPPSAARPLVYYDLYQQNSPTGHSLTWTMADVAYDTWQHERRCHLETGMMLSSLRSRENVTVAAPSAFQRRASPDTYFKQESVDHSNLDLTNIFSNCIPQGKLPFPASPLRCPGTEAYILVCVAAFPKNNNSNRLKQHRFPKVGKGYSHEW